MATADDEDAVTHDEGGPGVAPPAAQHVQGAGEGGGSGVGDLHTYIGSRLRQAFDDIASQPVPDRFLQLMRDLDKA